MCGNERACPAVCVVAAGATHRMGWRALQWWLAGVAALSVFGSGQAFFSSTILSTRQFSLQPALVTPLAHTFFGSWTLLAAILRGHCAFHIREPGIYRATLWSFIIALGVYSYEALWTRTIPYAHAAPAFFVASVSIAWMTASYRSFLLDLPKRD